MKKVEVILDAYFPCIAHMESSVIVEVPDDFDTDDDSTLLSLIEVRNKGEDALDKLYSTVKSFSFDSHIHVSPILETSDYEIVQISVKE